MQQCLKLTSVFVVVVAFVVAVQSQSQMMGEQFSELLPDTQLSHIMHVWHGHSRRSQKHRGSSKRRESAGGGGVCCQAGAFAAVYFLVRSYTLLLTGLYSLVQIAEKAGKSLDLVKINSAQKQVVAGLNYILVLETAAQSTKETYEAHVYGRLGYTLCAPPWYVLIRHP